MEITDISWLNINVTISFWDNSEINWCKEIFTVIRTLDSIHGNTFYLEGEMVRCTIVS